MNQHLRLLLVEENDEDAAVLFRHLCQACRRVEGALAERERLDPVRNNLVSLQHAAARFPKGQIRVNWTVTRIRLPHTQPRLRLDWHEQCPREIAEPGKLGLGLTLIQGMASFDLPGTWRMDFSSSSPHCRLEFPLSPCARTIVLNRRKRNNPVHFMMTRTVPGPASGPFVIDESRTRNAPCFMC